MHIALCVAGFFARQNDHFRTFKPLKSSNDICIANPDKCSGVVIINNQDYFDKIAIILNDSSNFKKIVPSSTRNNTSKVGPITQIFASSILN